MNIQQTFLSIYVPCSTLDNHLKHTFKFVEIFSLHEWTINFALNDPYPLEENNYLVPCLEL